MMMKLYSWGANSHGQLGLGYKSEQCTIPQEVAFQDPATIRKISGGGGHVLILDTNGCIHSCGWNSKGQLGAEILENTFKFKEIPGDFLNENKVESIACGWDVSAAVCRNGDGYLWGSNAHEQLGLPKSKLQYSSKAILLELPNREKIKEIYFNLRSTCVLCENSILYIFGSSRQVEALKSQNIASLVHHNNMNFWCVQTENMQQISAGQNHILILNSGSEIIGFGDNKFSQVTSVCLNENIKSLKSGWTHNGILISDGRLLLWGRNNYGQVGIDPKLAGDIISKPTALNVPEIIREFHLGAEHGLAISSNGNLFIWGWNEHGNCGNGSTDNVFNPIQIHSIGKCQVAGCGAGFCYAIFVE